MSELPSLKLGILAICPFYHIQCVQFTQNVHSHYDLSENCMLTIFQVVYEYYKVKVFVLQFLALFTEFIRTLSILRYRF